jgi:hypothetical protein
MLVKRHIFRLSPTIKGILDRQNDVCLPYSVLQFVHTPSALSKRISSTSPSQRLLLPLCSTFLVELELSFSSQIRGPCSTFLKSPLRSPPAPSHLPPHPAKRRRHLARRRGFKIMLPPVPLGPDHHIQLCTWGGADPPVSFLCMRSRVAQRHRGHRMGQLRGGEGNAGQLHDAGAAPRRRKAAPALLATAGETSSRPASPLVPAPSLPASASGSIVSGAGGSAVPPLLLLYRPLERQ